MDKKSIREYAKLMKELELTGLEITEGDKVIRLERQVQVREVISASPAAAETYEPAAVSHTNDASDSKLFEVKSPMVGVFYAAPTENSEPFVKVGDKVNKGDILCIVEAMKLMNEITAECDGTIAEVCLANGEVVEYGTVIFRIEV